MGRTKTTHKTTHSLNQMNALLRKSTRYVLYSSGALRTGEAGVRVSGGASSGTMPTALLTGGFSSSSDSHDDFKPKAKKASSSVEDIIAADVKAHNVFLYMKGVPTQPMCGFSNMAARILDAYGVEYGSRDVLSDPELREGIKEYTMWPTIPQVFIEGEFVGGSDILMEMHKSGELEQKLLKYMK